MVSDVSIIEKVLKHYLITIEIRYVTFISVNNLNCNATIVKIWYIGKIRYEVRYDI